MSTFNTLSPKHEEQIYQYLRFMRAKREIALKQLDNEFADTKNDRLLESMYSQHDVEGVIDDLGMQVRSHVRQEIGAFMGMTSIILKQLLEGAEDKGVSNLEINTGKVEDREMLAEIEKMRADAPTQQRPSTNRLISIKDEHARLMEAKDKSEKECKLLQERCSLLQMEASSALREKSDLQEQVEELLQQLITVADNSSSSSSSSGAKSTAPDVDVEDLRRQLAGVKGKLQAEEEESQKKMSESRQFQQLKKLLTQKSEQLVQARRRLARYEPDEDAADSKHADDDN